MIREKSAGLIAFRLHPKEGLQYLLLNIRNDYWNFAKGKVGENESEIDGAKREFTEETGVQELKIIDGWRQETEFFFKEERNGKKELIKKKLILFLAKVPKEAVVTVTNEAAKYEVINGYAWLDFKTASKYLRFKGLKQILSEANSLVLDHIRSFREQKAKGGESNGRK